MEPLNWRTSFAVDIPVPGDHVLYRHDSDGDMTDAVVVGVDYGADETPRDANVWAIDEETNEYVLLPLPWVTLELDTHHGRVLTRESRVHGSPGWFPVAGA